MARWIILLQFQFWTTLLGSIFSIMHLININDMYIEKKRVSFCYTNQVCSFIFLWYYQFFHVQTSFPSNIYVAFISNGDTITFIAKCVPKGALSRFHIANLRYVDIQHYHEVNMLQVTYYTLNAKWYAEL